MALAIERLCRFSSMFGDFDFPCRNQHGFIGINHAINYFLGGSSRGGRRALLQKQRTLDLELGVPTSRRPANVRRSSLRSCSGGGMVQAVQGKVGDLKYLLPEFGAESIDGIVATGQILGELNLRQQWSFGETEALPQRPPCRQPPSSRQDCAQARLPLPAASSAVGGCAISGEASKHGRRRRARIRRKVVFGIASRRHPDASMRTNAIRGKLLQNQTRIYQKDFTIFESSKRKYSWVSILRIVLEVSGAQPTLKLRQRSTTFSRLRMKGSRGTR